MAITLSASTFTMMPEGTYVFKITNVDYAKDFGKIKVTMTNKNGQKHFEQFSLISKDGSTNEKAINAFSSFARNAMKNPSLEKIEPAELCSHYIKGEISYREYTANDGTTKKATQKKPGTYWEECSDEEIESFAGKVATPSVDIDLNSLLG